MAAFGKERFSILSPLGAGGMGEVHEAFDRQRKARVALKRLRNVQPGAVARLKREFRSLQDLRHPNLVTLYELFEDDGDWFYTMELVAGGNFLEHVWDVGADGAGLSSTGSSGPLSQAVTAPLARNADTVVTPPPEHLPGAESAPRFDERRLREALRQLTLGLTALHGSGQIHRDIKPGNVLVSRGGRVVLLDFGLVTEAFQSSANEEPVGTVEYLAPEQADGDRVGPPADWYSVGVMLFEALTGERPFTGPPFKLIMDKQERDSPSPATRVEGLPEDLVALCVDLLQRDPTARPDGEEVARRLAPSVQTVRPGPAVAPVELVGRQRELDALQLALAKVRQGGTATVVCVGEAGIGKTALVRSFLDGIDRSGQELVCRGRCYRHESVPYKGIDGVIQDLATATRDDDLLDDEAARLIGRVFPIVRALATRVTSPPGPRVFDPLQSRHEALTALREWMRRAAGKRPTLMLVEDLHWAGADTWVVLEQLLQQPDAPAMLTLITTRDPDTVERLPGEVQPLPLSPLEPGETERLATALLRRSAHERPAELAAAVADRSKGNPLSVVKLVHHAVSSGLNRPDGLDEARISQLDPGAQRLLELLAVAGGVPLPVAALARASRLPPDALEQHLGALQLACLARPSADRIEPFHDLIRDEVVRRIPPERAKKLMSRLARALEHHGGTDPELLATLWLGAGRGARAAGYALQAATEADAELAFDRAARLYQVAIASMDEADPELCRTSIRLGHALSNAGRGAAAAAAFLRAAGGVDGLPAMDLRRHAAEQLLCSGHVDSGLELLEQTLRSVGLRMPRAPGRALASTAFRWTRLRLTRYRGRTRALKKRKKKKTHRRSLERMARVDACWSATIGLGMVDLIRGVYFQSLHTTCALRSGDPGRIVRALTMEAPFHAARGRRGERRTARLLSLVETLSRDSDDPHVHGLAVATAGLSAMQQGKFRQAADKLRQAVQTFRTSCLGNNWALTTAQLSLLWAQTFLGQLGEVSRRVPLLLHDARQRGNLYASASVAIGLPNLAWLANDDVTGALEAASQGMDDWSREQVHIQHVFYNQAVGNLDLYAGNQQAAFRRVTEFWPRLARSRLLLNQLIRVVMVELRGRAALAAARAGETGERSARLLARTRADAGRLERQRRPWAGGLAALLRAGGAACVGNDDGARRQIERSLALFEQADMALHAAAARHRLGRLLGGAAGAELMDQAQRYMIRQGVRAPERMFAMLVPW
jgi:serine/threonine protein kinase